MPRPGTEALASDSRPLASSVHPGTCQRRAPCCLHRGLLRAFWLQLGCPPASGRSKRQGRGVQRPIARAGHQALTLPKTTPVFGSRVGLDGGVGGVGSLSARGQMVSRTPGTCSGYQVAPESHRSQDRFPRRLLGRPGRDCRSFPRGLGGHCPGTVLGQAVSLGLPRCPGCSTSLSTWMGRDTPLPPPGGAEPFGLGIGTPGPRHHSPAL